MRITRVVYAVLILGLLFSLAPAVWAAEDTVPGSFTPINTTPTVSALEIYSDPELTSAVTNLTPQVMYFVKVTAGDGNTINDIDEIEVQIFYDAAASDPAAPGVADTQTCAIFTWDKDGGGSEWTVDAGTPTSWAITAGNCTIPDPMTASSGYWVFGVTPGKVGTESVGAPNWDVYAKATDGGGNGDAYTRDKEILWYGEITTSATAAFGSVNAGTGFADNVNEEGSISVTYTSNGNYEQQVKSDASWAGAGNTANYDATGACDDGQEFSLMAFISDTFGSAVQVDTSGVTLDNTGTITGETGNVEAANTLWLKLAAIFVEDTYNGNITYIILDR